MEEARAIAAQIGYPVVVRPSYVLGGRAMEIVYDEEDLERFVRTASEASPDHPVLIDRFLEGAIEVDVDAVCDGGDVFIGARDGAHRGGGGALGRLVVPDPAGHPLRRGARPDRGHHAPAGAPARRRSAC